MRTLTTLFKALSDETRLRMLGLLLSEGELCVCDFVEVLEISQSKASRHLRSLVNAGVLDDRREARWVYFRFADELGATQAAILEVLPTMLDGKMEPSIFARLKQWNEQKRRAPTCEASRCCSPRKTGDVS